MQAPQATIAEQTKNHGWGRKIFVQPFVDIRTFFTDAVEAHGIMFVIIIGLTYFLQGFRDYAFGGAITWYFRNLGLTSGQTSIFRSTILITWNIKFVYGLTFDNFPIFGRNYKPWYIFAALIGFTAALVLGIPGVVTNPSMATAFLFLYLMAMAMCDVIADGMTVKRARIVGARGGAALQTYCWIMINIGYLIGLPVSGTIVGSSGAGGRINNLYLWVYMPISIGLLCISAFIKEDRTDAKWTPMLVVTNFIRLLKAVFLNRIVLLPVIFIFARGVLAVDISDAYNFWLYDRPEGGLSIGADLSTYIDVVGTIFAILALFVYGKFLTGVSFRKIFFYAQIVIGLLGFMNVALFKGWNTAIGFPDVPFLMFSSVLGGTLSQLTTMPFLVMAAQLSPSDIEATFYAGMTSISNGGNNVATLWGGALLIALGVDTVDPANPNDRIYDLVKLEYAIWIKFALGFAPALLVWMLPNSSSIDPYGTGADKTETTVAEVDAIEQADADAKLAEEAKTAEAK